MAKKLICIQWQEDRNVVSCFGCVTSRGLCGRVTLPAHSKTVAPCEYSVTGKGPHINTVHLTGLCILCIFSHFQSKLKDIELNN